MITVHKIITPDSSKSELKTKEVTINPNHIVKFEESQKASSTSTITLSNGTDIDVHHEYSMLVHQIRKSTPLFRSIEVNHVLTFPSKTALLKTCKATINIEYLVSYEEINLHSSPFIGSADGTLILLSTKSDMRVAENCKSIRCKISEAQNNFWPKYRRKTCLYSRTCFFLSNKYC